MGEGHDTRRYRLLLLTVALGGVLAPLNSTMLAVALPEIREDFGVGHAAIGWLVSAYLIAMAVAQPIGGRIGDQIGRSRLFRGGLVAFLALSVGAAFAPTFEVLLLLRTGQALVGAAVIPNGMAMLRESVPPEKLGVSSGFTGSALSIAAATGPLLGAGLLTLGTWRWLFFVNLPLVGVGLLCHALLAYGAPRVTSKLAVDWIGGLSFAALLVAVTFALNNMEGAPGRDLALSLAGLAVFGALFVFRQFRSPTPVTDWSLFRSRSFSAAGAYVLLSNLVMYTTLLAIPFFVREVQGKGSATSGTLLGMMSVFMAILSPVAGRISDAYGRRLPAVAGSAVMMVAAFAILFGISRDVSYGYLAVALLAIGLGLGVSIGAASTAAIESVPRSAAGIASGTNHMLRYLGSIVGAGVLGSVLSREGGVPDVGVFRLVFALVSAMSVAGFLATMLIEHFPGRRLAQTPERVEPAVRAAS